MVSDCFIYVYLYSLIILTGNKLITFNLRATKLLNVCVIFKKSIHFIKSDNLKKNMMCDIFKCINNSLYPCYFLCFLVRFLAKCINKKLFILFKNILFKYFRKLH